MKRRRDRSRHLEDLLTPFSPTRLLQRCRKRFTIERPVDRSFGQKRQTPRGAAFGPSRGVVTRGGATMVSTWIEAAAKGRHGGPVRAGMWAAVVVGTHPIELDQDVWLEIQADDVSLGPLPAYWVENKGVNSLWHVPIPPQAVGARLHYRSSARKNGSPTVTSNYQDTVVRPNLPYPTEPAEVVPIGPEGLVGKPDDDRARRRAGVDVRRLFPDRRAPFRRPPGRGELPQSRSHFRAIVGGLAIGRRFDWFTERSSWDVFQHYLGATNLLTTELAWRNGPVRVRITDFAAAASSLPKTSGGTESPGQYLKRFRVTNEGKEPLRSIFGVAIQAEVNGGVGEPGLSWLDSGRTLLASNRGHGHANRKLARDATVEFAVALDDRGDVHCEPTGANEAILLRWLDIPAGGSVTVDPARQRRVHGLARRPGDVRALAEARPLVVPHGRS